MRGKNSKSTKIPIKATFKPTTAHRRSTARASLISSRSESAKTHERCSVSTTPTRRLPCRQTWQRRCKTRLPTSRRRTEKSVAVANSETMVYLTFNFGCVLCQTGGFSSSGKHPAAGCLVFSERPFPSKVEGRKLPAPEQNIRQNARAYVVEHHAPAAWDTFQTPDAEQFPNIKHAKKHEAQQ